MPCVRRTPHHCQPPSYGILTERFRHKRRCGTAPPGRSTPSHARGRPTKRFCNARRQLHEGQSGPTRVGTFLPWSSLRTCVDARRVRLDEPLRTYDAQRVLYVDGGIERQADSSGRRGRSPGPARATVSGRISGEFAAHYAAALRSSLARLNVAARLGARIRCGHR